MFIVISDWKRKLLRLLTVVLLVIALAAAFPTLSGIFLEQIPVFNGWFEDDPPSGNPTRVEQEQNSSKFNQLVDRFVFKIQDFYTEK